MVDGQHDGQDEWRVDAPVTDDGVLAEAICRHFCHDARVLLDDRLCGKHVAEHRHRKAVATVHVPVPGPPGSHRATDRVPNLTGPDDHDLTRRPGGLAEPCSTAAIGVEQGHGTLPGPRALVHREDADVPGEHVDPSGPMAHPPDLERPCFHAWLP